MRKLFNILLILIGIFTMFLVGFRLGKEKERARIPNFQEDSE